ncbi:MAG: M61 family peptidase, partial [Flammeovirgaceae bacterium]|nr:M61 family peptidase [Flammeovirgaceae bacterium]MDW8288613.1 M61 family peptidase [Flammeovirgaceae bacterium]
MIEYLISCPKPATQFLHITLEINCLDKRVLLQLAAWRPGRYQLQRYAKNIYSFEAWNEKGEKLK